MKTTLKTLFAALCIMILAFGPVAPALAATFSGTLVIQTNIDYSAALDLQTIKAPLSRSLAIALTNGTGTNQANALFSDERTLSSGGSDSLDLAGSLTDAFGSTITFATIKAVIIESSTANTVNLSVGGGSNPLIGWVADATDIVNVKPGGALMLVAPQTGYTVTASTGDILKVLAGAASSTYRITIIGTV